VEQRNQLLIYSLFVASGATALVYEVTWLRNLSLIFGASFHATSIVLASYMAGLSLGGFAAGLLSTRIRRPLRVYGLLEIGIAACALVLPTLLRGVDAVYVEAASRAQDLETALTLMRAVMAFGVLVVPTFLMGATLPVLIAGLVRSAEHFGVRLSWLYGANTMGAALGTIAAGFFLVPMLGVWRTQLCAVAINLLIGVVAITVGSRPLRVDDDESQPHAAHGPASPAGSVDFGERSVLRLVFWGAAVSGFCALALEVLWTRALSVAVGTTAYSFTVMLAAFLVGISLGSWLHAVFPLRRIRVGGQFGVVLLCAGLGSLVASTWIPRLPELAIRLNLGLYDDLSRIRSGTTLILAFLVMLIPCIFIGIAFPLANQARAALSRGYGRPVGETLGLNTLGSIGGSLVAGFLLIPLLGIQRSMLLVSAIYLAYGAVVLGAVATLRLPRWRWAALAATTGFVLCALSVPYAARPWEVSLLGNFRSNELGRFVDSQGRVDFAASLKNATIQYYREGRTATVSVSQRAGGRDLIINGKTVASDTPSDMRTQLMLGHVPVLMHPDPRSALVVGMGAGVTLGSVAAHESLDRLVLVEIEPEVLGAARHFEAANGNPLDDPRLRVHLQDGRNYLKTTTQRFDVITADPIHPWARGSGYLYTTEYYRLAAERLGKRGIMCQWLPTGNLSPAEFKSVVATFAQVFPHTMLWHSTAAILIGSRAPIQVNLDDMARRIQQPRVAQQLSTLGLDDPFSFVAELAMLDAQVREYAEGAVINNDDNLYLEFSSPLSIGKPFRSEIVQELNRFRERTSPIAEDDPRRETFRRYRRAKVLTVRAIRGLLARRADQQERAAEQLRALIRDLPAYRPAQHLLASYLAMRGERHLQMGRLEQALRDSREATTLVPDRAAAHRTLGVTLARQGHLDEAIAELERARSLEPHHWLNYDYLGKVLTRAGRQADAADALREGLRLRGGDSSDLPGI